MTVGVTNKEVVSNIRSAVIAVLVLTALLKPVSASAGQVDADAIIKTFAPIDALFEYADRKPSVELDIQFELGSARLTGSAQGQLDALADALLSAKLRDQRFLIIGHTDASGPADQNKLLSQRRAATVKLYLVNQHNIHTARLEALGLGEEKLKNPIAPESAENRRVEVILLTEAGGEKAVSGGTIEW